MNGFIPNKAAFFQQQLQTPPEDSKKWKMAIIGLKGIAGFFTVGTLMFVFRPEQAGQITTMVQIAMTAWGGVVGIYLGAQGSVEFKATSALQSTVDTSPTPKPVAKTVEQGVAGAPQIKPWGGAAATK